MISWVDRSTVCSIEHELEVLFLCGNSAACTCVVVIKAFSLSPSA